MLKLKLLNVMMVHVNVNEVEVVELLVWQVVVSDLDYYNFFCSD